MASREVGRHGVSSVTFSGLHLSTVPLLVQSDRLPQRRLSPPHPVVDVSQWFILDRLLLDLISCRSPAFSLRRDFMSSRSLAFRSWDAGLCPCPLRLVSKQRTLPCPRAFP